jgi:hypothetical protein
MDDEMKASSDILDLLELAVLAATKPILKLLLKMEDGPELDKATRNVVMKVGLRIAYGKESADKILLKGSI